MTAIDDPTPAAARRPRRLRLRVRTLVVLIVVAALVQLVVAPLCLVLWGSLRDVPAGSHGGLTLAKYRQVLGSRTFLESLRNTGVFALGSTVLALGVGGYLAWVTQRTNAPLRRLVYVLVVLPVAVPGIMTTIAWSLFLHPRIGIANQLLGALPGRLHVDGTSMAGMVWVEGMGNITLPFLLVAATLRTMDPTLEDASHTSGASYRQTLRLVTLPLLAPGILAAGLIVFIRSIDSFETPLVLGLPGGVRVLATDVWVASQGFPPDRNLAAAYAMVTVVVVLAALALFHRLTPGTDRFAVVTGRGGAQRRRDLGRTRRVHASVAIGLLVAAVVLPLLVMAYASLLPYYRPPSAASFGAMGLGNFSSVAASPLVRRAVRNNIVTGGGASVLAVALGSAVAWLVLRTTLRGRRILDAVASTPLALPGIVIGVALLWLYLTAPNPLYATSWIIGLGYVTAFLPYALRMTHAALAQVSPELEEASGVAGARAATTYLRVTLPLVAPAMIAALAYVFSLTLKALALPVLLGGPRNEVLAVVVLDLYESGRYPELNALGLLLVLFLVVLGGATAGVLRHVAARVVPVDVQP
jgi:iron(III) transport system permease protein